MAQIEALAEVAGNIYTAYSTARDIYNTGSSIVSALTPETLDTMPAAKRMRRGSASGALVRGIQRSMGARRAVRRAPTYRRSSYRRNQRTGGVIGRFQPRAGHEMKFRDTAAKVTFNPGPAISTSSGVQSIMVVPRGTGPTERIGQNIVIKRIQLAGFMNFVPTAAAFSSDLITVWMILDKECNGTLPAVLDIFSGSEAEHVYQNIGNSQRFTILKKWTWNPQTFAGTTDGTDPNTHWGTQILPFNCYYKCQIPVRWTNTNTDGSLSGITQNNILFAYGTAQSTGMAVVEFNARIRYDDPIN